MDDWHRRRDAALLALAREERPEARTAAAVELLDLAFESETHRQELTAELPRLLGDSVPAVRRLGDPEGARYLMERTRRRWREDRALAVELCGEVKATGALARLLEILGDQKDPCRGAAARGLGRLGDADALSALATVLEEEGQPE